MKILDMIWPRCSNPGGLNPADIFACYKKAVDDIEQAGPSADDSVLLTQSWKIFDDESSRRSSIDTRAGAIMPAISLAAALVTGIGFNVLRDATLPMHAQWIILATYVLALTYLVRTMLLLFGIHGKVFRHSPDPSDLPTPTVNTPGELPATSPYNRMLACKIMRYTIANYQVNNIQSDALFVAQKTLRNAIITIATGGAAAGTRIFLQAMAPSAGLGLAD